MNDKKDMQSEIAVGSESAVLNEQAAKPAEELKAGEKTFTIILFLVGAFFFWHAYVLWMKMSPPRVSSAAALPLFTSGVWTILSFLGVLENIKKKSSVSIHKSASQRFKHALSYVFPKEMLVILCAILAYCVLLYFKINFYVVTTLFLYGSMCYLSRKGFIKNLLWTGIFMAFTYVVFRVMFGVVFA